MANEGNAAGLAIGHFLAGGGPAVVYLQFGLEISLILLFRYHI